MTPGYIAEHTIGWIEAYNEANVGGMPGGQGKQWKGQGRRAPDKFLTPIPRRPNVAGAVSVLPPECDGEITAAQTKKEAIAKRLGRNESQSHGPEWSRQRTGPADVARASADGGGAAGAAPESETDGSSVQGGRGHGRKSRRGRSGGATAPA
eukprot:11418200-Alexandrium_andersonii.AAC.1